MIIQKVNLNCHLDNDLLEEKLLLLLLYKNRWRQRAQRAFQRCRAKPRFWVRQRFSKREESGEYHCLIQELKNGDREYFFRQSIWNFYLVLYLLK